MCDYKKIPTSPEVWAVIKAAHKELCVFSSYSAPDGDLYGNPDKSRMMTEYGFRGCNCPIMGAETTWDKNPDKPHERINEHSNYWLCASVDCDT